METREEVAAQYRARIERDARELHRARQRAATAADTLAGSVRSALLGGMVSEAEAARLGVYRCTAVGGDPSVSAVWSPRAA